MSDNKFDATVSSLFNGMENLLSSKTVVGDAVTVGDTIILPLVDVSFGVAAAAGSSDAKNKAGGGMGCKMSPSAVIVIHDGMTRLVNVKNQDTVTKIIDMVPDIMDKIKNWKNDRKDPDVEKAVKDTVDSMNK